MWLAQLHSKCDAALWSLAATEAAWGAPSIPHKEPYVRRIMEDILGHKAKIVQSVDQDLVMSAPRGGILLEGTAIQSEKNEEPWEIQSVSIILGGDQPITLREGSVACIVKMSNECKQYRTDSEKHKSRVAELTHSMVEPSLDVTLSQTPMMATTPASRPNSSAAELVQEDLDLPESVVAAPPKEVLQQVSAREPAKRFSIETGDDTQDSHNHL
eukprot:TRINITY_DN22077_c0_g1_i1.p1 TRINITY_DN22077_c0_g1~~TRINITY_DN22077_c0_g1_i1.p1  ORF type:complete len:214 (-),score=50.92 TRINITY_DN22077_c0_g1_i1:317-958(-)